jgi:hypothetical protein
MCGKRRHLNENNICAGCVYFVDRERERYEEPIVIDDAPIVPRAKDRINNLVPFNQPGI